MTQPMANTESPTTTEPSRGRRLLRIGLLILLLDLAAAMIFEGVNLRRYTWDFTQPVRHLFDIKRNYDFGQQALNEGFLNIYENQVATTPDEAHKINYPPLRLAVFEIWAARTHHTFPNAKGWQPAHDFNAFLMYFNTVLEFASALAAFLIVRHWIRLTWQPRRPLPASAELPRPGPFAGLFRATLAFILLWFSPAMLINAHGWPSPNAWVIPFFLWAVLLCCWDCWFLAGIVLGIGAMFTGQQLFVAGLFILWPLFARQYRNALKWTAGFAFAFALIAAGWMLTTRTDPASPLRNMNWPAIAWVSASAAALILVGLRTTLKDRLPRACFLSLAALAIGALAWPVLRGGHTLSVILISLVAATITTTLAWRLTWRGKIYVIAGVIGTTLLLCIPFFHAGTAWWDLGFMYGTERHPSMVVGPANNLCALLESRFGYPNVHEVVYTIPAGWLLSWPRAAMDVELRQLLFAIYIILFLFACLAVAIQWRRKDRNFLVAIVTPWLLFYAIPAQIHERYLLFAAGVAACSVGASLGLGLLDLFLILLTAAQTADSMMMASHIGQGGMDMAHPIFNRDFSTFLARIRPDISWAVLLACAIYFYLSFTRYRKPAPAQLPAPGA